MDPVVRCAETVGVTPRQIDLIKTSWTAVEAMSDAVAAMF